MPSLFFTCPKTRQQADTGIMTDAESLRDTWSMTLNVNCPHCGQMHAVSVRETYIDAAIRSVSESARREKADRGVAGALIEFEWKG
jgi:hypothetical protein